MAANVVRDYILPMFENDGKKILKKKRKNDSFYMSIKNNGE